MTDSTTADTPSHTDPQVPPPRIPDRRLGIVVGIGLVFAAHIVVAGLGSLLGGAFLLGIVGVTQLVYVIPGIIVAHVKGERQVKLGIVIGAAVTFLLNAGCWGVVAIMLSNMH